HRLDDAQRNLVILAGLEQRHRILGEAGAAEAGPGVQEFCADAVVEPDAARDLLHVGADFFRQIGDLVDEGDLGGEEGVGGVFDQLGGAPVGEQDRRAVEVERAIELGHHPPARASSLPTTTRSGCLKSWMAAPSRRNSGFDTTANSASARASRMIRSTSSPVPTGTVDLVITTVKPSSAPAISRAASYTKVRSAWPSPRREGVPTAINTASAAFTAPGRSLVNVSRPARALAATRSLSPGS